MVSIGNKLLDYFKQLVKKSTESFCLSNQLSISQGNKLTDSKDHEIAEEVEREW